MKTIVVVEDDEKLSSLIQKYLQQQQFDVTVVSDGNIAVETVLSIQPDVVILDLMLPGKDGLTICREIRPLYRGSVLFLTASEDAMDHVAGIEMGADDFVVKPIQPRVLLARIRMLLRRTEGTESTPMEIPARPVNTANNQAAIEEKSLHFGNLSLYHLRRAAILNGEAVPLSTSEFDLLWLLASRAEEVLTRDTLYHALRGFEYDGVDRSMDTKIANLRKKLGDSASLSTRIITVRGKGYLFVPDSWD